ncbi:FHA domain-containing protein [Prosthecobacter sp.]|uniref:FHA domain-containing protein n=1 Tax=Prosthecobacter sp. TaxID=1965333 RepID=UPI003783A638
MAKLTFVLEDGQEVVVPLKEHTTIGRDEGNDIVVDDERISAHHAEIVQNADGSLQVFDLKSTAGTFVNGESQISCTLLHGDTIAFGPLVGTLDLEHPATSSPLPFEIPASAQAAQPSEPPVPPPPTPEPPTPGLSTSAPSTPELPAPEPPTPEPPTQEPLVPEPQASEPTIPEPSAPPAVSPADLVLAETVAKLEAEKARLKSEVDTAERELRDWQQRAEKERALHFARVESLRAEEEKLAPAKDALKQAETAHHDWLEAVSALSSQHENKTAALERLNAQHYEKSTEVQRLNTSISEAKQEIEALDAQKSEAAERLTQVRNECEQDEALLNSLRQQIIDHEKRIAGEEARHAELNAVCTELRAKHQRDEAAVRDLESLLITLEQNGAAAEGSLQRVQQELAAHERELSLRNAALAARNDELATCESSLAACRAELATDTQHLAAVKAQRAELGRQSREFANLDQMLADARRSLEEAKAQRAEIEQQNQELAGTKQQLIDARQRLAAVEQRYRDVQASGAQAGSHIAAPKAAKAPDPEQLAQHADLASKIENARRELAGLEASIASLRESQPANGSESSPAAETFPRPLVVQVETIRLTPVPIKSERARGPGTKKAATR